MPLPNTRGVASAKAFGFTNFSGSPYWIAQLSAMSGNYGGPGIPSVDSTGNLYFGIFSGSLSKYNICKMTPTPAISYVTSYTGGSFDQIAGQVNVKSDGTVLSVGEANQAGNNRPFLLRYNSSGALTSQTFTASASQQAPAKNANVWYDSSGNYYTVFIKYDGQRRSSGITKWNSSNVVQWGQLLENGTNYGKFGYSSVQLTKTVIDSSGIVYSGGMVPYWDGSSLYSTAGLYKLNASTGSITWKYAHFYTIGTSMNYLTHFIDGSGNLYLVTALSSDIFVYRVDTTTGDTFTPVKFSIASMSIDGNCQAFVDSSFNIYVAGTIIPTATTLGVVKIAAGLGSATAMKITASGGSLAGPYQITAGAGYLYIFQYHPTSPAAAPRIYCLSTTLANNVGKTATLGAYTYTISSVSVTVGTDSTTAKFNVPGGATADFTSWSAGSLTASTQAETITSASFN